MVRVVRLTKEEGSEVVELKGAEMVLSHDDTSNASLTKHRAMEKHGVLNKEQAIIMMAHILA